MIGVSVQHSLVKDQLVIFILLDSLDCLGWCVMLDLVRIGEGEHVQFIFWVQDFGQDQLFHGSNVEYFLSSHFECEAAHFAAFVTLLGDIQCRCSSWGP